MTTRSLEGLVFADVTDDHAGDVGADTRFEYHEEADGVIWARYGGGTVRLGHLVGTREGDDLEFRYSHVTVDGQTANGHCVSRIVERDDGLLEFHERWQWESQPGTGTSTVREVTRSLDPR